MGIANKTDLNNRLEKLEKSGGGGGKIKDIYSESEILTNKVWLGLPVYRKIFIFETPVTTGGSWVNTPADVSDLNIDYITDTIIIGKDVNYPDDNVLCVTAVINDNTKKIELISPSYQFEVKMICIEYIKNTAERLAEKEALKKALSEEKKSTRKSTKKEVNE